MDAPWPMRAWIMAIIGLVAGGAFWLFAGDDLFTTGENWRLPIATAIVVAATSFVLTVEPRRLTWSAIFALAWGLVIGFVCWNTIASNSDATLYLFPFFSSVLAVLLAAPFFQAWRDSVTTPNEWRLWQLPYALIHRHAWTDAVLGAAGMVFAGLSMLLALLIGGLFGLIGIELLEKVIGKGWFAFPLIGAAFGAAVGLLRERDALIALLQRLVMLVLSVLAPVLAIAVTLFLLTTLGTGLDKLWNAGFSATAMTLSVASVAMLLINSVIGDDGEGGNRVLRWSSALLAILITPLSLLAAIAMFWRIAQYGWTPERLWGAIAVCIALAYAAICLWALIRGRAHFAPWLRDGQKRMALVVCGIAIILALPVVDFGAISTRDQVARLRSGKVAEAAFDLRAMAFDFGPTGRRALQALERSSSGSFRASIAKALKAESRWEVDAPWGNEAAALRPLAERLRVLPEGQSVPPALLTALDSRSLCGRANCALLWVDQTQAIVVTQSLPNARAGDVNVAAYRATRQSDASWKVDYISTFGGVQQSILTAPLELRPVEVQAIFVNGDAKALLDKPHEARDVMIDGIGVATHPRQ